MSKQDVVVQLGKEKQRRINAEAREKYWRDKFKEEALVLQEQDHSDLSTMLLGESVVNVPRRIAVSLEAAAENGPKEKKWLLLAPQVRNTTLHLICFL